MLNNKNKVPKKIVIKQSNENALQKKDKSLRQSSSTSIIHNKETKPKSDEINELNPHKALRDVKAIEHEIQITLNVNHKYISAFMALIKKLKYVEIKNISPIKSVENKADAWKRVAQDDEMISLANKGLTDYNQIINNYETT